LNFGVYLFARALAVVAVAFLLIGIQSAGAGLRERRDRPSYRRLGLAISDPGTSHVSWWWWPPQLQLSGRYHRIRFRYERVNRNAGHLLVECRARTRWEARQRRPGHHSKVSYESLDQLFPGWIAMYSSPGPVPWTKRSLDRRPLGFGTSPGIDLYRQTPDPFDAGPLSADLQGLLAFCAE